MHFADTLIARLRELSTSALRRDRSPPRTRATAFSAAGAMEATDPGDASRCRGAWSARSSIGWPGRVAIVKPQIAFFEQLGAAGVAMLEAGGGGGARARAAVLLDAKRGDIGSTAEGYARAYLEPGACCECDAITLNPYLGRDTLEPFAQRAESFGRGLFVLAKTSNEGSGDLQDLELKGGPVYEVVAGGWRR